MSPVMQDVRPAAVAGTFYEGDARALARNVDEMLAAVPRASVAHGGAPPKAIVVPHAGHVYSGPIAATAYASVTNRDAIERIVLVGPSHRVFLEGVAAPSAAALRTPLGDVVVDRDAIDRAGIPVSDAPHAREHSLEVQLPFIQRVFPKARVCPIVCGRASPAEVAGVLEKLWGGPETLVVASSDLSHYLPYDVGREADERTAEKIVALDSNLDGDEACGYVGLRGLLEVAKKKNLVCELLDLRSSGDTAGPRAEVVGYGAFALWPKDGRAS
jgi:AmmeMemoRadiSam system protein B